MTTYLPNQPKESKAKWRTRTPSRDYQTLPRSVVPLSKDYPAMTQIVSHQHEWSQLAYSCSGVMHIETDAGMFVLPPEQALWLPPNVKHQHFCKREVSYRSLHIDAKISKKLGTVVKPLTVDPLLKAMIIELSSWPKDYVETAETDRFIHVLLDRLALAPSNELFMPTIDDRRLLPIIETLNLTPGDKLTIEQWSIKVGASSRTLNRLFNQYYGMGFSRWKQKLRTLKSLELLSANMPITDIAFELGYESSSAFITAFKKQLGCSPKKYLLAQQQ